MNSQGRLQLILREGDKPGGMPLKKITLLGGVPGSPGQLRAWAMGDPSGRLIYRASFSDGSQVIETATVP